MFSDSQRVVKSPCSDGLSGQAYDASQVPRYLEANKFPYKGGHADLTLNLPLCDRVGDYSDRLHQQDDRGVGVPSVQLSFTVS